MSKHNEGAGAARHTPGPWRVGTVCPDMVTSGAGGVCSCANLENAEANARLIAASPDLLAACKAVLETTKADGRMLTFESELLIRSAILKAEGGAK
jgi:hypothetical protein